MSLDLTKLAEPFNPSNIEWRIGATNQDKTKGMALAYIDARHVMRRLDDVCGPGEWQNRYTHAAQKTVCEIGIRIDSEWIWKADGSGDSDTEAEKGALSGAFKRAAVRWGIGRYLYEIKSPWVAIKNVSKNPNKPLYVFENDHDPAFRKALHTALGGQVGGGEAASVAPSPTNTGTGQRKPDGHNLPPEEMDHLQEYVSLVKLIKNQATIANLEALGNTDRFKTFCEVAPISGDHLRGEYKAQREALTHAARARAA